MSASRPLFALSLLPLFSENAVRICHSSSSSQCCFGLSLIEAAPRPPLTSLRFSACTSSVCSSIVPSITSRKTLPRHVRSRSPTRLVT